MVCFIDAASVQIIDRRSSATRGTYPVQSCDYYNCAVTKQKILYHTTGQY
jgi:hypothetical protein